MNDTADIFQTNIEREAFGILEELLQKQGEPDLDEYIKDLLPRSQKCSQFTLYPAVEIFIILVSHELKNVPWYLCSGIFSFFK